MMTTQEKADSIDPDYISLSYAKNTVKLCLPIVIANGIISINTSDFAEGVKKYADTLRKHDSIKKSLEYTGRMLQKYEEYID